VGNERLIGSHPTPVPAAVEWMARGAPFTSEEILSLFEGNSPLLRDNPYAPGGAPEHAAGLAVRLARVSSLLRHKRILPSALLTRRGHSVSGGSLWLDGQPISLDGGAISDDHFTL